MADEHVFRLTFEASGEVTPAPKPDDTEPEEETTEPEPEEAEK